MLVRKLAEAVSSSSAGVMQNLQRPFTSLHNPTPCLHVFAPQQAAPLPRLQLIAADPAGKKHQAQGRAGGRHHTQQHAMLVDKAAAAHSATPTAAALPAEVSTQATSTEAAATRASTGSGSSGSSSGRAQAGPKRKRASYLLPSSQDDRLRGISGVGPKNEALLRTKGLASVRALKECLRRNELNTRLMAEYLQESVGIRRQHSTSITEDIRQRVEADVQMEEAQRPRQRKVTLCVEGNIATGKSSFLGMIRAVPELAELIEVVPEPVDKWQNVGNSGHNVLDQFYKDPKRFAYTFQNYVFITRMQQESMTRQGPSPLRVLERSVFSDRMVFVRAVHENKWLTDMELDLYDEWFTPVISNSPSLVPDGFIYLQADPEVCMTRLKRRQRDEEGGVTMEYLNNLHKMHEEWITQGLKPGAFSQDMMRWSGHNKLLLGTGKEVLQGSKMPGPIPQAIAQPKEIAGKVLYLDAERSLAMPRHIDGVPTLVLSYDKHLDLKRDSAAKADYAQQVKAFFHYVQRIQEERDQLKVVSSIVTQQTVPSMAERQMLESIAYLQQHSDVRTVADDLVLQLRQFAEASRGQGLLASAR